MLTDLGSASAYVLQTPLGSERPEMIARIPPRNEIPLTEDDDAYDESKGENEAPVRETDELTELPEEMEKDAEDYLAHPEDDDADIADEALDEDDVDEDDDA
jgi:hypothetical protein